MGVSCVNCGWSGTEDEARVRNNVPSPDGTYARIFECPDCGPKGHTEYVGAN